MQKELSTAQIKRLVRRARADYQRTHALLGEVALIGDPAAVPFQWHGAAVSAETVMAVTANYRAAQALDAVARSLRLNQQVLRLRKVANDNLDVAGEALHCLTLRANNNVRVG